MTYKNTRITDFEPASSHIDERPASVSNSNGFRIMLTNRFSVQFTYVSQLLQYALKNSERPKIPKSEYQNHLGLPRRHSDAVCAVSTSFDLIREKTQTITQIGRLISEGDPYLEYVGSLWILHYNVSSNKKWLIWNMLLNEVFPEKQKVTLEQTKASFENLRNIFSKSTMTKRIPGEITTILDVYITKSFNKLGIIEKKEDQYFFNKIRDIPPEILVTITLIFRERYRPNSSAISINDLWKQPNSPGRILNIEEETIRKMLEQAKQKEYLYVERKADLDQIRFREGITVENLLKKYYEGLKK